MLCHFLSGESHCNSRLDDDREGEDENGEQPDVVFAGSQILLEESFLQYIAGEVGTVGTEVTRGG